jgi:D-sedoheptulose 7-phosphate isomerase
MTDSTVRGADARLVQAALRKARESAATQSAFFEANSAAVAACARAIAEALRAGGRIYTMGNGGSACDAEHLAVEFMHPIFEKRRRFPAVSLGSPAYLSAVGNDTDFSRVFVEQLRALGNKGDVLVGISTSGQSANVNRALQAAREMGVLTVGLSGKDGGKMGQFCDHAFRVESFSIHRIQETHVTLLHVLWDLVHMHLGEEDVTG